MKNIAIVPARSGSKGLPDKNIRMLNGKPLMAYSIESAKKSGLFDEIMVSTDSEEYAKIAKEYGANVPFLRSDDTSGDKAGSWDVVTEVLEGYLKLERCFDTVCLLQPTSPLRTAADIVGSYELYKEMDADAVTSVCETEHSPLWCMTLPENLSLSAFRAGIKDTPRQELDVYYRLNGAIYIRKIAPETKTIFEREYAYVMDKERSVDIDDLTDFMYAEFLIGLI